MRRSPPPRVLRNSPFLFRTSIDHDIIVPSLTDEDGRRTAPSSASHKFRFVPKGLRISGPDSDKARLKLRVFCREPAVVGKEGHFFSIVADRKYLLAGGFGPAPTSVASGSRAALFWEPAPFFRNALLRGSALRRGRDFFRRPAYATDFPVRAAAVFFPRSSLIRPRRLSAVSAAAILRRPSHPPVPRRIPPLLRQPAQTPFLLTGSRRPASILLCSRSLPLPPETGNHVAAAFRCTSIYSAGRRAPGATS